MATRRINTEDGFIQFDNNEEYQQYLKKKRVKKTIYAILGILIMLSLGYVNYKNKNKAKVNSTTEIKNETSKKTNSLVDEKSIAESKDIEESNDLEDSNEKTNQTKLTISDVTFWDNVEAQGNNTYVPANMLDGNPATTWALNPDEVSNDGEFIFGPVFTLKCKKLSRIVIQNGYAKSEEAYKNNSRASHIIFYNADNESGEIEQTSYLFEGILRDTPDKQTLEIDPDLPCNNDIKKIQILFPLSGIRYGAKWRDLCISEIEFWGDK